MGIAYVLISCEVGAEKPLIDEIKAIDSVKDVNGVMGSYDILVKLEASDELKDIVKKIRKLKNIRTTLTLTVIETQG